MSDHDLIVETHRMVEQLWTDQYGNGQPGVDERLTRVETQVEERTGAGRGTAGVVTGVLALLVVVGEQFL